MDRKIKWHKRAENIVNRVNTAFPSPDFENWGLCEELILNAISTYEQIIRFKIETEIAVLLLDKAAFYLSSKASYSSFFPVYQVGIETRSKVYDLLEWTATDNTHHSEPVNNTGILQLPEEILDIWDKALKCGHPVFTKNFNKIDYHNNAQSSYNQSLYLYLFSLAIKEKILNKYHPSIAFSLSNVANIYQKQNKYEQAEFFYCRSLAIFEAAFGQNHQNTKAVKENLEKLKAYLK